MRTARAVPVTRAVRAVLAALVGLAALTACSGGGGGTGGSASGSGSASSGGRTVTVLAAASLAGPMATLEAEYEKTHPGVDVRVTTGGSSELVAQLAGGLRADVLATADARTMTSAADQHLVTGTPARIATNTLTLVTAPGNPLHLTSLTDAGRHDLVVCAAPVPCGAATARLAKVTGERVVARSEEQNVTSVLEKVRSGQADAGVVYVTDAKKAKGAVTGVPLRGAGQVVNTVMAAATPDASADGRGVLALLTGSRGRAALDAAGFGRP